MKFYQLKERLIAYQPELRLSAPDLELLSIQIGPPNGPPEIDTLYLLTEADTNILHTLLSQPCNLLLCNLPTDNDYSGPANLLLLASVPDVELIFRLLQKQFCIEQRLSFLARSLIQTLSKGGSLQQIVDEAFRLLHNPISVFDMGFKLIAAGMEASLLDPQSQKVMQQRYLAPEDMKAINYDHIHQRVLKSTEPILVRNPYYKGDRIISRLSLGSKNVGHVVMTDHMRPFNDEDYQAMSIVRDIICQKLQQDEFIRNSRGFHYEYLITDLLDGKVSLGHELRDRLSYVDLQFEELIYVAVIEMARSTNVLNPVFLRDQLETLLPGSRTVLYNGQIVIVITRNSEAALDTEERKCFRNYCIKTGLYCGLSNPFFSVAELPDFYRQALRGLELGLAMLKDAKPSLYFYQDYAVAHLCGVFCQKESPLIFCHPGVRMLIEYDRKNNTQLLETLRCFLLNERNVSLSAQKMYLHRNTLMARLKKINAVAPMDLDDIDERQYVMASLLVSSRPYIR